MNNEHFKLEIVYEATRKSKIVLDIKKRNSLLNLKVKIRKMDQRNDMQTRNIEEKLSQ